MTLRWFARLSEIIKALFRSGEEARRRNFEFVCQCAAAAGKGDRARAAAESLPSFETLQKVRLEPGDHFVLTVPSLLTKDNHDHLQRAWKSFVGGDAEELKLLIIDGGMKLGAISVADQG